MTLNRLISKRAPSIPNVVRQMSLTTFCDRDYERLHCNQRQLKSQKTPPPRNSWYQDFILSQMSIKASYGSIASTETLSYYSLRGLVQTLSETLIRMREQMLSFFVFVFLNPTTASVVAETVLFRTQADQWAPGGEYSRPGKSLFGSGLGPLGASALCQLD